MRRLRLSSEGGFSLVEILVVTVIMGLVMTSVFSLFLTQKRTANTSDEVIDVQQNMRIAYDMIARDIRMAGFAHANPIAVAEGNRLVLRMASPFNRYARIESVHVVSGSAPGAEHLDGSGNPQTMTDLGDYFIKIPAAQAQPLRSGNIFRVIRPQRGQEYFDGVLTATADPYRVENPSGSGIYEYYLPVEISGASVSGYDVGDMGDILARVPDVNYDPYAGDTVELTIVNDTAPNQSILVRTVTIGGTPTQETLATKILRDTANPQAGLDFDYIVMAAGTTNPAVDSVTGDDMDRIATIQVRLTGATSETQTGSELMSGVKTREVVGRIQLKNYKIKIGV